jgi:lysophospholipase L1-like esterase
LDELRERFPEAEWINAGVGGNDTEMARERFELDVTSRKPDLVLFQFGINDAAIDLCKDPPTEKCRVSLARYEANLVFFLGELRQLGSRTVLMTPNPIRWTESVRERYGKPPYNVDAPDGFNRFLSDYVEVCRRVGRHSADGWIDIHEAFLEVEYWWDRLLLDGIHPNAAGHQLAADCISKELKQLIFP